MAENLSYLDRLYNEFGQLGSRVKENLTQPSRIVGNFTTPYQSIEEQARLSAQQSKEDYMAMQDSEQPQAESPRPQIPGLEDEYLNYLEANKAALTGPYLPHDQYTAPTREEFQKYFIEGQAPPKAIPVSRAVSEAAVAQPGTNRNNPPTLKPVQEQPQRPKTMREYIASLPFEGDRYEATRKVMENAKRAKINEAYAYADAVYGGVATVEGARFIEKTLPQIEANIEVPKPLEETEAFRSAQQALVSGKHPDRLFMLAEMKGLLESAKTIKNKDQQISFLELNLPKLAQSIAAGADAIQPAEAARIMPELNSVWQNPSQALELMSKKGFIDAFSKQPERFIQKLGLIYDSTIPSVNQRTRAYQNQLGPAFPKLGVGYLSPIGSENTGVDMTKLQQLREGRTARSPVFSTTYPGDRSAANGPQVLPNMRGVIAPSSFSYGSAPIELRGSK